MFSREVNTVKQQVFCLKNKIMLYF